MSGKMIVLRPDMLTRSRGEMTLTALAKKAGVARATVSRIENGHAESVTFDTVNKLAEALEIDADVLVTFVERTAKAKRRK